MFLVDYPSILPNCFISVLIVIEDPNGGSASQAEKEEVDARSIYVGNVRLSSPVLAPAFILECNIS